MYTSGTTGRSKGVMVAHAHAFEYANGCASVTEVTHDDIYYSAGLPLFHVAGKWGVVFGGAIKGATVVIPRQFSATNFWNDVRKHGVTATYSLGGDGKLSSAPAAESRRLGKSFTKDADVPPASRSRELL